MRRSRREGAAAVEFALVAGPFFFMLFALFEIGIIFVTNSVLENAVLDTGRMIRTGEADTTDIDDAEFKAELCSRMSVFENTCDARAVVDVREIVQFRNPDPPNPVTEGEAFDESELGYATGGPSSLMLVRVWYKQPMFSPFMRQALPRANDGDAIMVATTSFRNEPYQ